MALPLLVAAICLGDICTLRPSDSHTAWSLMTQYLFLRLLPFYTSTVYTKFITRCKDVKRTQENLLLRTLTANASTEYGRQWNFESINNREQYVEQHPVTEYKHYENYIQRVCNGEKNVMCARELCFVAMSSGTTGKFKKIPIFSGAIKQFMTNLGFFLNFIAVHMKGLQRVAVLRFKAKDRFAECGVRMGPTSCYLSPLPPYGVTPQGAGMIQNEHQQCYVTALFILAVKDLQYIDAMLAPMCLTLFKTIEQNAEKLVTDLRRGRLSEELGVDDDVRAVVNEHLNADPSRAAEVEVELRKGNDRLALRLWPHLKMIGMNTTGEFESSARLLRASFLKDVFIKTLIHAASEGNIGIVPEAFKDSVNEPSSYAFSHSTVFLEFIPEENIGEVNPRTLFLEQLELGKSYEIVVTNSNGFYRYRLGDVIRVTGFLHQNPLYEFMYRSGQLLSVKAEKTSSADFYEALRLAEKNWNGKHLVNHTATESPNIELIEDFPEKVQSKCYFLFIEVTHLDQNKSCILNQNEKQMRLAKVYGVCRANGSIAPMQVVQVKEGTFARLKSIMIKDTNNQQYKTPRALRNPELLTFLLRNDVSSTSFH
ncbi:hypothetical protein CAPTEDRAFT_195611 [Capitella teleta]|uniref:GH3 domain-containing protein n=1 Tax=Capitella teleta TaxID=283909 RepID=R7TR83_CAPTE|nr:hypothetical protein CAPTEDRAFT_195611 [Capitella teleta]|eukprot:ELT96087.1 hypothetical protein CAPTEDRAFT_195611 [Capitella teleta]